MTAAVRLCAFVLCSAPLVRRPQEKPSQFKARTCCDAVKRVVRRVVAEAAS